MNIAKRTCAPIAFFAYNRPVHTHNTLRALSRCLDAASSEIFVFIDGPKPGAVAEEIQLIERVQEVANSLDWPGKINIVAALENKGLTRSITEGISEVLKYHDRVIVVEDDVECGVDFLRFCNHALDFYEDDERVMHIGGFIYPSKATLPDAFIARPVLVWGWATWKRAWDKFSLNAREQLIQLEERGQTIEFNLNDSYDNYKLLQMKANGEIDTWDVCWYASVFLNNGYGVYPGKSLIKNTGIDGTGSHFTGSSIMQLPPPSRIDTDKMEWPHLLLPEYEASIEKAIRKWNNPGRYTKLFFRICNKLKSLV